MFEAVSSENGKRNAGSWVELLGSWSYGVRGDNISHEYTAMLVTGNGFCNEQTDGAMNTTYIVKQLICINSNFSIVAVKYPMTRSKLVSQGLTHSFLRTNMLNLDRSYLCLSHYKHKCF